MTRFAVSAHDTRIAYDAEGSGPALVLLHGGGQDRTVWRKAGWMERLAGRFRTIATDIRGHGESDKPADRSGYAIDCHCADILAVADAEGARRFSLWGYSYGGNIGRYLAARSDRVERFAMIGVSFGPAADRAVIRQIEQRWQPVLDADRAGTLDPAQIPEPDRPIWLSGQVPVMLTWLGAMMDWPPVEPTDMRCPTLWLSGTANLMAMEAIGRYEGALRDTKVQVRVLDGLTHAGELERADQVLPPLLEFMDAA